MKIHNFIFFPISTYAFINFIQQPDFETLYIPTINQPDCARGKNVTEYASPSPIKVRELITFPIYIHITYILQSARASWRTLKFVCMRSSVMPYATNGSFSIAAVVCQSCVTPRRERARRSSLARSNWKLRSNSLYSARLTVPRDGAFALNKPTSSIQCARALTIYLYVYNNIRCAQRRPWA